MSTRATVAAVATSAASTRRALSRSVAERIIPAVGRRSARAAHAAATTRAARASAATRASRHRDVARRDLRVRQEDADGGSAAEARLSRWPTASAAAATATRAAVADAPRDRFDAAAPTTAATAAAPVRPRHAHLAARRCEARGRERAHRATSAVGAA